MIRQFKLIILCSLLLLSSVTNGQDSIFSEVDARIDSLHKLMTLEMDQQIRGLKYHYNRQFSNHTLLIDSLFSELSIRKEEHDNLVLEKEQLLLRLVELNHIVESNKLIIKEEHKRFKRILLITGPSILALVILSAVLFFMLIIKYKDQTDRKISALKKYTHSEIEDTRNDLLNKFKKRLKKISGSKKKGKGKKEKSKK